MLTAIKSLVHDAKRWAWFQRDKYFPSLFLLPQLTNYHQAFAANYLFESGHIEKALHYLRCINLPAGYRATMLVNRVMCKLGDYYLALNESNTAIIYYNQVTNNNLIYFSRAQAALGYIYWSLKPDASLAIQHYTAAREAGHESVDTPLSMLLGDSIFPIRVKPIQTKLHQHLYNKIESKLIKREGSYMFISDSASDNNKRNLQSVADRVKDLGLMGADMPATYERHISSFANHIYLALKKLQNSLSNSSNSSLKTAIQVRVRALQGALHHAVKAHDDELLISLCEELSKEYWAFADLFDRSGIRTFQRDISKALKKKVDMTDTPVRLRYTDGWYYSSADAEAYQLEKDKIVQASAKHYTSDVVTQDDLAVQVEAVKKELSADLTKMQRSANFNFAEIKNILKQIMKDGGGNRYQLFASAAAEAMAEVEQEEHSPRATLN